MTTTAPTTPSLLRLCKQIINEPKLYGDAVVVARWAMERIEAEGGEVDAELENIIVRRSKRTFSAGEHNEIVERMPTNFGKRVSRELDQFEDDIGVLLRRLTRHQIPEGALTEHGPDIDKLGDGTPSVPAQGQDKPEHSPEIEREWWNLMIDEFYATPPPERVTEQELATLLGTICHKRPMEMARAILQRFGNRLGGG